MHKNDKNKIYLDNIIERSPAYIFWKGIDLVYLGCNYKFANLLGKNFPKEIIGKTDAELGWGKGEVETYREGDLEVIKGNPIINVEEEIVRPDGSKFTMLVNKTPLRDEYGNCIGILGISIDITERKIAENALKAAKEAAEAATQAKTEFVQNMQHDIRTPTSGLWGMLDFLVKNESDSNKLEALKMGLTASKRLLDLCNDAVEFGDLSGHSRPQLEKPLDVRQTAKSVIELNLPAAFSKDKDLAIHFKVDPTVPAHIISDEFRISRILINLLGNAVKFSHKGEIALSIKANIDKENTRYGVLVIEVKDTGIGISTDKINSIYEKFTRAVASNTNKYPGTGLGLYVVKTFLDDLGGDIEVESHENEGAYFKVSIPFKVPLEDMKKPGVVINERFTSPLKENIEKKENIQSKDTEKLSEKTPFSHELLIIEDDKTCLFAEKNLLSGYTNKIDSAENVADALKKLSTKRYDLVISDLGLPDGSGNDIVARIKASPESPNHQTPFVAMTAHQDAVKHKQATDAGFLAIGTKPLSVDKAVEFLKTYPAQGSEVELEGDELSVIDIALGMKRIGAKTEGNAIEALGILYETLQEDIPALKEAQRNNDIPGAREVLHKIRGGLYYSGAPRLEEAFQVLHAEVKLTPDLAKIELLFSLAYDEVKLFADEFKKLVGIDKK